MTPLTRRSRIVVSAAAATLVFGAVLAGTLVYVLNNDGSSSTPGNAGGGELAGEVISQPEGNVSQVGGSPPEYEQPVLMVPGDYKPPSASSEAQAKFAQAIAEASAKPQFNGEINGFRLYGWANAASDPSLEQKECASITFPETELIEFTYLPPGTKAFGPQYAGVCADGSTAWVVQEFGYGYGRITVGYELGERAIGHDAAADRVTAAMVQGRQGVTIAPLIEEGIGQSVVAFEFGKGFIVVGAQNLPLAETVKIGEGIRCADC